MWKDTRDKCQNGYDGEYQTRLTDSDGGADGMDLVRYDSLEDEVNDPTHEEEKGPGIMNLGHCCFLKAGSGKDTACITPVFFT